ncbi:hypothetical protein L210DRAFT_3652925 [Boletus edulis BED1]|uniref:Uncharacterized protein n=1 Tax=Boletus edulis BED1 TaxID=1328754 RepID=A0AAD4G839_BOLED|nr:hypothetical protein L210DRAFT_3652925 [Boletus edulis BED1]
MAAVFMRTSDSDAEKYLKQFTLLPVEEIFSAVHDRQAPPEHRTAQKLLAEEAALMAHGRQPSSCQAFRRSRRLGLHTCVFWTARESRTLAGADRRTR